MAGHSFMFFFKVFKTYPTLLSGPDQVTEQHMHHFMQTQVLNLIPSARLPLFGHNFRIESDERLEIIRLGVSNACSFFFNIAIKIEKNMPVHEIEIALDFA